MIDDNILRYFRDETCLVTGGTGLIGRQITDILCSAGANVIVVSLDDLILNKDVRYYRLDLTHFSACNFIMKNVDYVFHVAGIKASIKTTVEKPATFFVPLLQMNTNVLEAARLNNVKKLVYTSSIGAYSNKSGEIFREKDDTYESSPMDFYPGWAKRVAELQIEAYKKEFGIEYSIVRLCSVFGPGDNFDEQNAMVIPSLMQRIYKKEDPLKVWGDGTAIRDFLYSRDAAEGIILALYHGTKAKFVNLGSGVGYSIKELVETLNRFVEFNYVFDATRDSGFKKRVMDISLAKETIKFDPTTSLEDGLKNTWNWFINNREEYLKRKNYFDDRS